MLFLMEDMFRNVICCDGCSGCVLDDGMLDMSILVDCGGGLGL